MTPIMDLQWEAYRLTQQEGKSIENAAKEMGVDEIHVVRMLCRMRTTYPDLFVDISGDGRRFDHGVSRYDGWCEGEVKEKF